MLPFSSAFLLLCKKHCKICHQKESKSGPELAVAILAVSNWASCVLPNANGAQSELESDLKACNAKLIIGLDSD